MNLLSQLPDSTNVELGWGPLHPQPGSEILDS